MSPKDKEAPGGPATSSAVTRAREGAAGSPRPQQAADERSRGRPADGSAAPRRQAPKILVCDEGELEDVVEMLRALDQRPLRVRPAQLAELLDWERPSCLFVTTVRVALSRPLSLAREAPGTVCIAVADSDAHTLCTAMLRRGFRYVVRRPVHPAALRLLLMQVLYTGEDSRVVARFPFGAEVRWRSGLSTGACTMSEISAHGCRLLTREPFALDSRIHLRVPATLPGAKDLRLRGRVVRRETHPGGPGQGSAEVAVRFERLSARSLAHLDALLAECASGPATSRDPSAVAPRPPPPPPPRGPSRFATLTADPVARPEAAPRAEGPATAMERRRRPRGSWHNEVLALDAGTRRVQHVLLGTDLSTAGLRVEPHPLLRIGDRLTLGLYDAGAAEPVVVRARVAHEDGRRGWGLIFEDLTEGTLARLQEMVGGLPPVSTLSARDDKPEGVVLGEIMTVDDEEPR